VPKHIAIQVIASAAISVALGFSSAARAAAPSVSSGQQVFARCAGCHSTEPGENRIGPSLAGVFGRKSGSEPNYNYSPALKAANITWDEQALNRFLADPSADVQGTKMLVNVPDAADRQNVVSYLETLK
jgi:cytochrome c